ncbi:helicase domain isoform C [Micractinium conductrix]|uniref:Helicase domain isoform C n=1 Tax=Micractinium conductrix TaxID=554055 RepID=A0A2P6VIH8_9CHLO|nr:helicase domain isoform C [Micractinium conductrix]|eukprot:PSC73903.1 helicase domain isoform C [Micractinium conductrix]
MVPPGTQLIFRFERRGDGWAEEILPHLVVEQRPLEPKKKRVYSRPDPWKEGSLECYLVDLGVPPEDVDRVVTQAVAWRVTPGGRSLIDRRRRSRVERNVRLVVEHLELECKVPFGPKGIAAILARCPEIMLCKPTTNDRWDRRAVELGAYLLRHGHCNVPEDWVENPELGLWVKRQRIARAAGQLSDERLSILQSMGFAFGEVAQLTEEWEHRFDQLVDWMLWHNENQQPFSWLGVDWGARGGITARELALWTTLQREYRDRGLLPGEALSRFEAIGVQWDNAADSTPAERRWMAWFGRLLHLIERHNPLLHQPRRNQVLQGRPKMGRPRGSTNAARGVGGGADAPDAGAPSSGELATVEENLGGSLAAAGDESDDEEHPAAVRRGSAAVAAARLRLQEEMGARRAALAAADLRAEPGLRFWLERQRRRWRKQELPSELALMLQLSGVQLDSYSAVEWRAVAHTAAALLQGSEISWDPSSQAAQRQRAQQAQQQQQAVQEAAWQQAQDSGDAADAPVASPLPPPQRPSPAAQLQPAGSARLRAARWVQTQQALLAEGKLSQAQLCYMAFLGITWVLSEEVVLMPEPAWQGWCAQLEAAPRPLQRHGELWEWLQHQRGLHALGWLPARRQRALAALQVDLSTFDRSPEDSEWDRQLTQLLAFKAEHGHCRLPPAAAATDAAAAAAARRWAPLAAWLAEQHRCAAAGRLPPPRAAQLAAIGAAPAAGAAAATPPPPPAAAATAQAG